MNKFIFGNFIYEYQVIRQDRKTLSLTVTPDLKIILKCSPRTDKERIEKFLRKKWIWLEKQLSFFKKYQRKLYKKEYISGESFLYLGRQYKLLVKRSCDNRVLIDGGRILIYTNKSVTLGSHNKKILENWLYTRTEKVFNSCLKEMMSRFDYEKSPILIVRDMKKRWGSFLNKEKIILNPKLIHTSRDCIDYVIVHELCHLKYKNHNANFWKLLDKKYPKWEKVKDKLEMRFYL